MKQDVEKLILFLSDTESIPSDDDLSEIVGSNSTDELSETELDEVSAAAKPDYDKFLKRLNESL